LSAVTEILQLRKERRTQKIPFPLKAITTVIIHKKNDFLQRQQASSRGSCHLRGNTIN
jgi:hypothetical protein